ncbi:hypothetical protein N7G274_000678 [Stereocaulon virgatum]|uniref:Uncharacterized protein n=1 Tax=Stereocaulon virgatum TaxID=373712 RepID=A0ABR4AQ12_9LECA
MSYSLLLTLGALSQLPTFGMAVLNGSITSSTNSTDALPTYSIPNSDPATTLRFDLASTFSFHPYVLLVAIIEFMQPACHFPYLPFPAHRTFDYMLVRIILSTIETTSARPMTHNVACIVLRGLAEFMVLIQQFHGWVFSIFVGGTLVGKGAVIQAPESAVALGLTSS